VFIGAFLGNPLTALRTRGIEATHVARVAELEQWPTGAIVITDPAHYTDWWRHVGASHVVVVAEGDSQTARGAGADVWITGTGTVPSILHLITSYQTHRG
jgi:hypothetical protein